MLKKLYKQFQNKFEELRNILKTEIKSLPNIQLIAFSIIFCAMLVFIKVDLNLIFFPTLALLIMVIPVFKVPVQLYLYTAIFFLITAIILYLLDKLDLASNAALWFYLLTSISAIRYIKFLR